MTLSRRQFLASSASLAAAGLTAPAILAQPSTPLTFAFAPDESGAIRNLIDGFNADNDEGIEVTWSEAPENSDDFYRFLVSEFRARFTDVDCFGSDVIWTAEFASNGWIEDLSRRAAADIDTDTLLPAALNSAYWRNRLWAVPWYTDAGLLFYRRDLLEEAGIPDAPTTWDELATASRTVMDATGIANGLVLQGARYEGGVTNALEFIWSAGGRAWTGQSAVAATFGARVSDPNVIVLDSRASARGLAKARQLVAEGIIPAEVTRYDEREALRVFSNGDAVFMRNWPFAYGLLGTEDYGPVSTDQVGVTRIPTLAKGTPSYSCLGGWNLAINARSDRQSAAWSFIRYALDAERQGAMAETGGYLPVRAELYEDASLRETLPVIELGVEAVRAARARPSSPIYSQLSPRLAIMFNRVLTGELAADEAVARTTRELRHFVSDNRY